MSGKGASNAYIHCLTQVTGKVQTGKRANAEIAHSSNTDNCGSGETKATQTSQRPLEEPWNTEDPVGTMDWTAATSCLTFGKMRGCDGRKQHFLFTSVSVLVLTGKSGSGQLPRGEKIAAQSASHHFHSFELPSAGNGHGTAVELGCHRVTLKNNTTASASKHPASRARQNVNDTARSDF